MMKGTLRVATFVALAWAFAGMAVAGEVEDPASYSGRIEDRSKVCMIQDSVQPKSGLEYAYQGKKYYLCCGGCLAGFSGDPERHSRAKDPVSGALVDKAEAPAYAWQGRAYFFASQTNLEAFARDPDQYLSAGVR